MELGARKTLINFEVHHWGSRDASMSKHFLMSRLFPSRQGRTPVQESRDLGFSDLADWMDATLLGSFQGAPPFSTPASNFLKQNQRLQASV
jgi:hypothetical protein